MTKSKPKPAAQTADYSNYAYASILFGLLSLLAAYLEYAILGGILAASGLVYGFAARNSPKRRYAQVGALISLLGLLAALLAGGVV